MTVNAATIDLITEFEGWVDHWYRDPIGIWTCCYGHTDAAGEPKYADTKSKVFTKAEGRAILANDLAPVERFVRSKVTRPLNDNQLGALVSFTYNCGGENFAKSTLLKKINAGDMAGAAKEFPKWNKAAGKVLKGLVRRRAAEQALFLSVTVSSPAPIPPGPTPPAPNGTTPEVKPRNWLDLIIQFIIALFTRRPSK